MPAASAASWKASRLLACGSSSGRPICNAIVWQCRRTAPMCDEMRRRGLEPLVRERTGLVIDAYFSATKLRWILEHMPGARQRAELAFVATGY